ncbi:MAG: GNAT family N-acetyltransferase [Vicinamibacterales bacterium]
MMALAIRPALVSDADDIAALTRQLGYELASVDAAPRLSRLLSRSDQLLLIAEIDGRAVGWIHAGLWEDIEAEAFVVIGGLVVDRGHRRQGIGQMLIERAEEWAREQGCSIVRLWSSATRTESHRFYECLGYTNIKTQYAFVKSLDGADTENLRRFVPRVEG